MKFLKNLKKNNVIKTALVSLLLIGCVFTMLPQDADAADLGYTDVGHNWETPSTCSTCGGDHLVSGTCYTSGCATCGGDGVYYKCNYCSSTAQTATSHKCSGQGNNTVGYVKATHTRANYVNCSKCYASGTYKGKNTRCKNSGCSYNYYAAHSIYPGGICYQTPNKIKLTLNPNGGSGGTSAVWYYYNTPTYYSDEACTTNITAITKPTRPGYDYVYYAGDGTSGGTYDERYISYWNGTTYIEFASDLHSDIYTDATLYANWTPKTIQLTLDKQGGSGGTDYVYYKYGTSTFYSDAACTTPITSITRPTRAGYTFKGYVGDGTNGGNLNENYIAYNGIEFASDLATEIYDNATLNAKWELETYTVTYHNNGGSGAPDVQTFYMNGIGAGTTMLSAKVPTRAGYTFTGWLCQENGITLQPGQAIPDYWGTMNLDAQWSPSTYTITYHGNGGLYNGANTWSETVTYNTSYTTWSNDNFFVREGHTFTGWNEDPSGNGVSWTEWIGKPWTWSYTQDVTLYAQWSRNQYTVTYDANGGKLDGAATAKVYYEDDVDLSPTATKDGRIFLGWAESPDASTCLTNKKMPSSDITLYARYSLPISDVREATLCASDNSGKTNKIPMDLEEQNANGYVYSKLNTNLLTGLSYSNADTEVSVFIEIYDHAGNLTIVPVIGPEPPPLPVKYLQTVKHWTWNMESEQWMYLTTTDALILEGEKFTPEYLPADDPLYPQGYYNYQIDAPYTVTQANEVNAYYKPIAYKLYFDPNGGSCDVEYKTVYNGGYIGELPTAKREGYDFLGWFTEKTDSTKISDGDKFTGHEDMTVYAHWEIHTNKVIYDYKTNLGQSADFTEAEVEYGANVDLTNKAYKDGWVFVGWNTDPDETTGLKSYKMPDGNLYLYAIYKKDIVATFIDKNDGGVVTRKTNSTIYNKSLSVDVKVLEQNKMTGWECLGWSKQTTGKADIEAASGATITITDNITLYGCYVRNIKVSYDTNGSMETIPDDEKEQFFNAAGNYTNPKFTLANGPQLEKHSFVKWEVVTGKDVGKTYNAGSQVEFDRDTVLKAVWDQFPEIEAYDRYFTLEEAQNGEITPEKLFEKVTATDREDGLLDNGTDVTIPGYTPEEFKSFTDDGSVTVTYKATDSFGNETTKTVTVYIIDTTDIDVLFKSYVRFIDKDYYKKADSTYVEKEKGGLEEHSKWKTDEEYAIALESVLSYEKINIETNKVTVLGKEEVVPDLSTGEWVNKKQTWTLNKNTIEAVEEFVDVEGYAKYLNEDAVDKFYEKFGDLISENGEGNPFEYRVLYNANGGSGTMEKQVFQFDVEYSLRTNTFTKSGYTFAGWNTKEDGSGNNFSDGQRVINITSESMIMLYAQWTPVTYNINYNLNGGTGVSSDTYNILTSVILPIPSKTGYVFDGWYSNEDLSGVAVTAITEGSNGDKEYWAKWSPATDTEYIVNHWLQNVDGNASIHNEANYTKATTDILTGTTNAEVIPEVRTYEGFTSPETQIETISADGSTVVNYYYTRKSYTVVLNKGEGIESVEGAGKYLYGAEVTINASLVNGYEWVGWTGTQSGSNQKHTFILDGNVTNTANSDLSIYKITYVLNEGTLSNEVVTEYTVKDKVVLPMPVKAGYSFVGWYESEDFSGDAVTTISVGSTSDKTFYAKWDSSNESYNITLIYNDNVTPTETIKAATYKDLPNAEREGYELENWYVAEFTPEEVTSINTFTNPNSTYPWTQDSNGVWSSGNAGKRSSTSNMISEEFSLENGGILSFDWKSYGDSSDYLGYDIYNVTTGKYLSGQSSPKYSSCLANLKNGTSASFSNVSYDLPAGTYKVLFMYGKNLLFNNNDDKGYVKNVKVTIPESISETNVLRPDVFTSDLTLCAKWTPANYSIIYHTNGGIGISNGTYTIENSATLQTPSKTGYTFAGWYDNENLSGSIVTSIAKGSTGDKDFWANWEPNTDTAYTVNHWLQNVDGNAESHDENNYTKDSTENFIGTTDAEVCPEVNTYEGFSSPEKQTVTIKADGSLVVDYYYARKSYTIVLNKGEGIESVEGAGKYPHGAIVTISATVNESKGYYWNGWTGTRNYSSQQLTIMVTESATYTANAKFGGLFDADGNCVATWDKLVRSYNLDIETDYIYSSFTSGGSSYALTTLYNAFRYNSELSTGTNLVIPSDVVTSIGNYAFYKCSNLTSITIPDNVTSIGNNAFANCTNLTSIVIPEGVTSIEEYTFDYCESLASVEIPSTVTSIGNYAFEYCESLTSVTIPSTVTSIGESAFRGTGLTSIVIPEGVTSIRDYTFAYCYDLTSVNIPSSVTSIGEYAFTRCGGLTSVAIPEGVTFIGNYAFQNCKGLTSVTIPSTVTSIGKSAFATCFDLTSVYFKQTTAPTLGNGCFEKTSGDMCIFYFKNSTVADALLSNTDSSAYHYRASYGTKSTDYNW